MMGASPKTTQNYVGLLAEQAQLVARLNEITTRLSSTRLPEVPKTADSEAAIPSEFDRKAYAIGLLWRNPAISTRELAKKVGVARSTLFLPSWSDVAAVIRARKNLCASDFKDHHVNEEDDQ